MNKPGNGPGNKPEEPKGIVASLLAAIAAFFSPDRAGAELSKADRPAPTPAPRQEPTAASNAPPPSKKPGRKTLASVVGLGAAASLFVLIPREESGRVVEATVENGEVVAKHVRGPEHRTPYRDIVGVWTVCDGDTKNVVPGQVQTREQCMERLESQIIAHVEPVLKCVPTLRDPSRPNELVADPARANQVVAAASLAYNIGPGRERPAGVWTGGFCGSTAARRFNARDWVGGCDAFARFNKAGGRVVRGLELRREREIAICKRGL